jgi:hypothetical protein
MAVQINLGPLSMDLEKLLIIIKELFSVKLDKGAKDAIKELIDELMKLYDDIVKTLLPFYDIIDDATFEDMPHLYRHKERLRLEFLRNQERRAMVGKYIGMSQV